MVARLVPEVSSCLSLHSECHSLVSPAAATLNATAPPAPLRKVQLNRFTLTELYDRSPQAWCDSPLESMAREMLVRNPELCWISHQQFTSLPTLLHSCLISVEWCAQETAHLAISCCLMQLH